MTQKPDVHAKIPPGYVTVCQKKKTQKNHFYVFCKGILNNRITYEKAKNLKF